MARRERGVDGLRRLGRPRRAPGGAHALAQVRLALLAHLVRHALSSADDERDLGLLAAQPLELAFDLGALGRPRCVGEGWLVADGRDVAHVCMVAQAAAIMRRKTSGRMPPWRRYSASAGESMRASTSNSVLRPSSAVASTVRRCVRCDAARDAADREALAAVEAERGSRLAVDVLQRKHAHAHEVGAVDALEALGDHGADAEQQRALGRPVARRAGAVLLADERHERHVLGRVALGGVEDRERIARGQVRRVAALLAARERVAQADVAERARAP